MISKNKGIREEYRYIEKIYNATRLNEFVYTIEVPNS